MKVLILGASHAELPMIQAARFLATRVDAAGLKSFGRTLDHLDSFYNVDYSKIDEVQSLINANSYDAVLPGCNDFAAITCSELRSRGSIYRGDSLDTAQALHLKNRFRRLCAEFDIPSPKAVEVSPRDDLSIVGSVLSLPVIVKPIDLTGGRGITVVHDASRLAKAARIAEAVTRQPKIIVEEYLPWTLHSASYIVLNEVATRILDADEFLAENHFLVSSATMPSGLSKGVLAAIDLAVEKLVSSLRLSDGVLHVQFLSDGVQARVLEVCRRPPGDLYVLLPMFSSGFDFPRAIVYSQLSIATDLPLVSPQATPTLRLCVMTRRNGVFVGNEYLFPREVDLVFEEKLMHSGDPVLRPGVDKSAIIFLQSKDLKLLREIAENPNEFVKLKIGPLV